MAILKPGFEHVVNHPVPDLALSLPSEDFALRANTAINDYLSDIFTVRSGEKPVVASKPEGVYVTGH